MSTEKPAEEKAEDFDPSEYMKPDAAKVTKPRVHDFSSSACIGCEG
jgi:hypothetical protein